MSPKTIPSAVRLSRREPGFLAFGACRFFSAACFFFPLPLDGFCPAFGSRGEVPGGSGLYASAARRRPCVDVYAAVFYSVKNLVSPRLTIPPPAGNVNQVFFIANSRQRSL